MKKEPLLLTMNEIDDSYIAEADMKRPRHRKIRAVLWAATLCLILGAISLLLFLPLRTVDPVYPDISQYEDSEYYPLIESLNQLKPQTTKPIYRNRFEVLLSKISSWITPNFLTDGATGDIGMAGSENHEVTDNQVHSVTEADRYKRNENVLFYLNDTTIEAYSIEKEKSKLLSSLPITMFPYNDSNNVRTVYKENWGVIISQDGNTLTILTVYRDHAGNAFTAVISIDVSNPSNMTVKNTVILSGFLKTLRVKDESLFVFTNNYASRKNYQDLNGYVPQIITNNEGITTQYLPLEKIYIPDRTAFSRPITDDSYTVVYMLDLATLTVKDAYGLLSFDGTIFMSENNIYLTRNGTGIVEKVFCGIEQNMTEIACLSYHNDGIVLEGTATVEGYILNQYCMDEYDGILRVVTTTSSEQNYVASGRATTFLDSERKTSASLYLIDLAGFTVRSSVENFAPVGEVVRSVRFDQTNAYVCTSYLHIVIDPVFFFDLSDPDKITYKDTGNTDGYSSSLVDFGNGYLLGIGNDDLWSTLKLEAYTEGDDKVESVCQAIKESVSFSRTYKSYLIDREHQLVGLGITKNSKSFDNEELERYLLFQFTDGRLVEIVNIPLKDLEECKRATYINGYLYAFGEEGLTVTKVELNA